MKKIKDRTFIPSDLTRILTVHFPDKMLLINLSGALQSVFHNPQKILKLFRKHKAVTVLLVLKDDGIIAWGITGISKKTLYRIFPTIKKQFND